tara:strand:- start:4521 stop:5003 length:483 start_codon:yes stop_codon:yes gene_type:complete
MIKRWPWFLLSLSVVFADLITKYWAKTSMMLYVAHPVFPGLNLTLAYNTGAAFSFLSGQGGWHRWFFAVFSVVMSGIIISWLIKTPACQKLKLWGLSFILGGALGNLYDRAAFGYVVDFIDVYYKTHHWPIFNLADSAICLGAFLLLLDVFCYKNNTANK